MSSTKALTFHVTRKNPELLSPAEPTPYEFKYLSDIDNQDDLRFFIPMIYFYRANPSMEGKDPVSIIRDAVAKALVFYYPLAGRLKEYVGGKLVVECTSRGVVFVEADADVTLQQFGDALYPPFPNLDKLILDIPGRDGIINSPLLLIQVTRLKCGGFILAYLFNHVICDGAGISQFVSSVGELACGATVPSVLPVWQRDLLTARNPPRVSFRHPEYDVVLGTKGSGGGGGGMEKMAQRSFFFGPTDIFTLRRSLPPHLQACSKFDIVAACVWRCRTIATSKKPDEEAIFLNAINIRNRMTPPLPVGYYGNAVVSPAVVTTAEKISKYPLHYAVELLRKAKSETTDEYARSVIDLMRMRDRPRLSTGMNYFVVSDLTHVGFEKVEVGWGKPVYGGVAVGVPDWTPALASWFIPFKNKNGEEGIMVHVCLPLTAMEEFVKQLPLIVITAQTTLCSKLSAL